MNVFIWLTFYSLCPPLSSEPPLHSLTLTPSTRQVFREERFTVRCLVSQTNSSGWMLRQFSPRRGVKKRVLPTERCPPLGGAARTNKSDMCMFTAGRENSGLYWCEGAEGRSNAVNITVSCESCVTLMFKANKRKPQKTHGVLTVTHWPLQWDCS